MCGGFAALLILRRMAKRIYRKMGWCQFVRPEFNFLGCRHSLVGNIPVNLTSCVYFGFICNWDNSFASVIQWFAIIFIPCKLVNIQPSTIINKR
jgi:hypothetical protein